MDKKIILITGATSGIGKEAALQLAKQGHTITIHGRNKQKTETVCQEIMTASGNDNIDMLLGDMFLLSDVKKMAVAFLEKYSHLDVLINNAGGIMDKERALTQEGFEKTMVLNLFAPFLLISLLIVALRASKEARIINTASMAHNFSKVDFQDIQLSKNYKSFTAYSNSKLFLIWISRYFSSEFKKQGIHNITINTLHPGVVATNFAADSNLSLFSFFMKLAKPFLSTPQQGAETIIYLASSEQVKNTTGRYFAKKKEAKVNEKYYTLANEKLIWDYCMDIIKPFL